MICFVVGRVEGYCIGQISCQVHFTSTSQSWSKGHFQLSLYMASQEQEITITLHLVQDLKDFRDKLGWIMMPSTNPSLLLADNAMSIPMRQLPKYYSAKINFTNIMFGSKGLK